MSFTPRLFVSFDLSESLEVRLEAEQANYLGRVLRLKPGDKVRLFNGREGEWVARLSAVERKEVRLAVETCLRAQPSVEDQSLDLWFSPVKRDRTEFIVEKATELGVRTLQPILTSFTQTKNLRLDRLSKIALEAAEQTERLDLPKICEPIPLMKALESRSKAVELIFCDEAGDDAEAVWGGERGRAQSMLEALKKSGNRRAIILTGPEGGFSPEERMYLRSQQNVTPVSLGPRILRAETAVVAALSVWQAALGDWR